jgi:hypothetical protein
MKTVLAQLRHEFDGIPQAAARSVVLEDGAQSGKAS